MAAKLRSVENSPQPPDPLQGGCRTALLCVLAAALLPTSGDSHVTQGALPGKSQRGGISCGALHVPTLSGPGSRGGEHRGHRVMPPQSLVQASPFPPPGSRRWIPQHSGEGTTPWRGCKQPAPIGHRHQTPLQLCPESGREPRRPGQLTPFPRMAATQCGATGPCITSPRAPPISPRCYTHSRHRGAVGCPGWAGLWFCLYYKSGN